ncbi:MAG TPA: DUF4199 domain-containing protein [Flavisolibacter sp.]|jgi:hypothetical protein|nr:DUF4199 domain-containing protein [Flavisolibacter sp.]
MEQRKPISPIIAGLIVAGVAVIFSLLLSVTGAEGSRGLGLLNYIIIIAALAFLIVQYGKANRNQMSFGELFGYGFKATAIYTLIFLIFLAIMVVMSPDMKQKTLEVARVEMEKQGRTDAEIDQAINIADRYYMVGLLGGSVFMLVLIGTIGSLIGAAVTKKNPKTPFDQENFLQS